jgi:hypothetical protein
MGKAPFVALSYKDRDLDIIPLVNFALFSTTQSQEVAEAGLKATLSRRREQLSR